MISVRFQGKPSNIMVIQVYVPTGNAEKAEVKWFYEDLQDLWELTPLKRSHFHYRGLEYKSRKSRNTWSNRQIWLWSTEEAGQRPIEFYQECTVIANTLFQQYKRRLYTWTSPDGQHRNQIDYILWAKEKEALYSQQNQDWELTVGQKMNSLLPNSDLNWRKWEKPLDHSGMT